MVNKNTIFGKVVLLIGLVSMMAFFVYWDEREDSKFSYILPTATPIVSRIISHADWVSNAETVSELVLESDLIVGARVSGEPVTRVLRRELSVFDENNNIVGSSIYEALFSDTTFETIKIYLGKPPITLSVMQTGGFPPMRPNSIEEVVDDPLYKIGEEYVLFLVDISGDRVQAPDRELYRTVNPFGRYGIDGTSVFSYGENLQSVQLPVMMSVLETQIDQAIQKLGKQ